MCLFGYVSCRVSEQRSLEICYSDHGAVRGVPELWLSIACVCRDEAQPLVQGFPGAKFKKFKTQPEADQWYRSNLPRRAVNPQTTAATPSTSTIASPNVIFTSSSSTAATYAPSDRSVMSSSKPIPQSVSKPPFQATPKQSPRSISTPSSQSISKTVTTFTPKLAQPLRIAAPKNAAVDIVYSDGACKSNGFCGAVAGIGVWWGPDDPRYDDSSLLLEFTIADRVRL